MKVITLTRGLSTVVDDDVYEWASVFKWFAGSGNKGRWYAARTLIENGRRTTIYLHRLIAGPSVTEVDHRDGDSLNNQIENLRCVTHQKNMQNRRTTRARSGYRGVEFDQRSGKFRARAKVEGRTRSFGSYVTAEEAAQAAEAGRRSVWGAI
jgi:hypothetical protein